MGEFARVRLVNLAASLFANSASIEAKDYMDPLNRRLSALPFLSHKSNQRIRLKQTKKRNFEYLDSIFLSSAEVWNETLQNLVLKSLQA